MNKIFVSYFVQNYTKALIEEVLYTRQKTKTKKQKKKTKSAISNMTQNHKPSVTHPSITGLQRLDEKKEISSVYRISAPHANEIRNRK